MLEEHPGQVQAEARSSSTNAPTSKSEQIQEFVDQLADRYGQTLPPSGSGVPPAGSGAAPAPSLPEQAENTPLIGHSLDQYQSWLAEAHQFFRKATHQELTLTYASEWVLDNDYIIRQSLRQIREDLPPGYYARLPRLQTGRFQGLPRIYAILVDMLSRQRLLVNLEDLEGVLRLLQERIPLTMGELWAVPTLLRYGLIAGLAHALAQLLRPNNPPDLPETSPTLPETREEDRDGGKSDTSGSVATAVLSLRAIAEQNWNDFFESVSKLESILRTDPAGIYAQMDFRTRDLYRKEIEKISHDSSIGENQLAELTIAMANEAAQANGHGSPEFERRAHVGEYLIGQSRPQLEQRAGYHPRGIEALRGWVQRHSTQVYLGGIGLITLLVLLVAFLAAGPAAGGLVGRVVVPLLLLVPALTIASSLVNWLVTLLLPPHMLPKLSFREAIPEDFSTLVAIPAMLTGKEEIDSLVRQLEMHFLRNSEPGLLFALLTDFGDADQQELEEDQDLLDYAAAAVRALNAHYERADGTQPFFFLHRPRKWNASEGKWIGWERKRGKLHELNQLILGKNEAAEKAFLLRVGDLPALHHVRFVLTADADTVLPRGTASRMAGTLAHPLNRAIFDPQSGKVNEGYTILQPRMEISPTTANHSWFSRIFAGDTGLDLYTLAVSDAYHDLFGEGIFVGKGMYDVAAFERSTAGRIPENAVLSHDLLEGLLGRAALVSDITMIEDYPPNYFVQTNRMRRWVRGDWQLLPWLIPGLMPGMASKRPAFSIIDRWKMIDNLRRSLVSPALAFLFAVGMLALPQLAWLWLATLLITLGIPVLTSLAHGMEKAFSGEFSVNAFRPVAWDALRWLLALAFLPYEAYLALDAIFTTLARVLVTHRNLLQWTTAAQAAKIFGTRAHRETAWQKLGISTLIAVALAIGIQLTYSLSARAAGPLIAPALWAAAPVLLLWACMPLIVREINRPIVLRVVSLTPEQSALMRRITRRTWGFFERFVGPEDHWLPPDHYQESPVGIVAHTTSPTNIGLLLTSTLAAYDFGYLDPLGLATRLTATMDNLEGLERYRGHFLNWYDTLTLQPLQPRYVSTVDSGNLAACLIVTAEACKALPDQPIFRWEMWQGYLDTLANLSENVSAMRKAEFSQQAEEILQQIDDLHAQIQSARETPDRWYSLFQFATGPFWQSVSHHLMALIDVGKPAFNLENLRKLQEVAGQIERHHLAVQRTITTLVPWITLLENPPALLRQPPYQEKYEALHLGLPYDPSLRQVRGIINSARPAIQALRQALKAAEPQPAWGASGSPHLGSPAFTQAEAGRAVLTETEQESQPEDEQQKALQWLDSLERAVSGAVASAGVLLNGYNRVTGRAEQYVREMDFRFLYHGERRVFHIGYNLDAGQLDQNDYDLMASESRIASLIAIAYGDVPQNHWLHLGRPVTRVEGLRVLLSWSATMFEYLMPPLFLPSYPGTLLAESEHGATLRQISYGKSKDVPWGISESGFYRFDGNQNYQYRAFGVPGLGFKRGLGDDLVIAPYASMMAIGQEAHAVYENALELISHKMLGVYGFYEAIDFTNDRLLVGQKSAIVREYMAHHQGMVMLSMVNFFHNNVMVKRMMSDPRIESVDLLLQEQVPLSAPLQSPTESEVKGVQRLGAAPVEIVPWTVPVNTPIPQLQLLSNGSYGVLISNAGGGYSSWQGTDLTRWQPDGVLDPWGTWVYIQEKVATPSNSPLAEEEESFSGYGPPWSAAYQPAPDEAGGDQVTFFGHMAVFRRSLNGVTSSMEVAVSPDDPVEMRVIHLYNSSDRLRQLRLTSYGEVILTQQANDTRHPAFNKLFIESEWVSDYNLQIFKRRPRSENETPVYLGHMLVPGGQLEPSCWHEADRARFIGRGADPRFPNSLRSREYLTGSSGATLDPIFALGTEVQLEPHTNQRLAFLTFSAESREEILELAVRYQDLMHIERTFHQADLAAHAWLGRQNLDTQALKDTLQMLSALVYPFSATRADPEVIAANNLGQSGLWRFGVSGDYPVLLVQVDDPAQVDLVREALQVHRYLRSRHFMIDLVILNRQQTNYGAELNGMLYRLVSRINSEQWLNQRGGVFILYADQMRPDERTLLLTAARVVLTGERGGMGDQLPGYSIPVQHLPEFTPTRIPVTAPPPAQLAEVEKSETMGEGLLFFNGHGGFAPDGREYIISLPPRRPTPAPWVNVIGYPQFGFLVTEAGSQCTWAINSGENRLTPWSNDPVRDPSGEILYLRDEETGEHWTPTPLPAGEDAPYQVRHGAGYSIFEHESHGLKQRLALFASPEDPVKIIHLRLENTWDQTRRITATQYVDWVLGTTHFNAQPYLVPDYDTARECLLARNPYNAEFSERAAFLAASKTLHGLTADRTEFLGRNGSLASPVSFRRLGLERRITPGEDPCGVLQLHIDLPPGGVEEIYFLVGQGDNTAHAQALVDKYHDPAQVEAAWQQTLDFWERLLEKVQVRTPEPAADLILNRWLLYQALSCRIWGRTAFYQSSGAFGFRDQLQDVLTVLPVDASIARKQILDAAWHQFEAGDVLHWWHPPSGRGVRTRFSDDLLWLPYVTAQYVEATGDAQILAEKIPFLQAPPLKPGEDERYGLYEHGGESYTLFEHCRRAIEKGATQGEHGLPLMGTGDWNDGMNRVGEKGEGESVWLAWFLCDVLKRFANLCEMLYKAAADDEPGVVLPAASGQAPLDLAPAYRQQAQEYAAHIEQSSWDGAWYRRAYYDDGSPLGSARSAEAKIDSIAQSWSVLSGAGEPKRARQAMQSVLDHLVRPADRLILLFTPPFDKTPHDPGYIKGYLPGIRENGGQYTHAAIWTAWAYTTLRDGAQAGALFDLLNPVFQADSPEKAAQYRVEPYVVCADIYSVQPYLRRGGWTWYTGSAAWLYRLGLEAVLGLTITGGDTLHIDPVIPPTWDGFEITYRFGQATYRIKVSNPRHVASGLRGITLDERFVDAVRMVDDGQEHQVEVVMGEEEKKKEN